MNHALPRIGLAQNPADNGGTR